MDIFDFLTLLGGLCLFLFGMQIMGQALERRAGSRLQTLLERMTSHKFTGLLTGLGVTAVIQSSSATTVMVVGFVNSGLMRLRQAIYVIMGANIGTTVTAWLLSLAGITGQSLLLQLLKPSSFTPILALIGIVLFLFCSDSKRKDTGTILLGFATLMYGMETMSGAVAGLADVPAFRHLFLLFQNTILGVLAGAILTAIIQSSSASVGILQALAGTGQISYAAAIPIIMGQNIGTCITAILASFGTNKNAKRAAMVHLSFNVIGSIVWLSVFCFVRALFAPAILSESATLAGIATVHSAFNLLCTALLYPATGLLEQLAYRLVPDGPAKESTVALDTRLLATPAVALERCRALSCQMADDAASALQNALACLARFDPALPDTVRQLERQTDRDEDLISTYLVKLSAQRPGQAISAGSAQILRVIGDLERIGDHSVNLIAAAQELHDKHLALSPQAATDLGCISRAVTELLQLTLSAYCRQELDAAAAVLPLSEVVCQRKEELRMRHIARMQQGHCSVEAGFVWADLLTALERVAAHCANIASAVTDASLLPTHQAQRAQKNSAAFRQRYDAYAEKYPLPAANAPV